jgi:hypothetical protein
MTALGNQAGAFHFASRGWSRIPMLEETCVMRNDRVHSNPIPPRLPLPKGTMVREALRDLRHAIHLARDTVDLVPLPPPVEALARPVLRGVDRLARQAEAAATEVAHGIFGGDALPEEGLSEIEQDQDSDSRFARTAYVALRAALTRLEAPELRVSEATACDVHRAARLKGPSSDLAAWAATLTLGALRAGVVRGAPAAGQTGRDEGGLAMIALFAVMLWLICDPSRNEGALAACVNLAAALRDEILAARDEPEALAALFTEFKHHV